MIPISQIKEGQQFKNPMFKDSLIFFVEEVNSEEKMIKIQSYSFQSCLPIGPAFWKKNTDRMFSESWRLI